MTERMRNMAVGVTALLGLVGLAALLMVFGWTPAIFRGGYEITVHLPDSGGLTDGSRVRLNQMDIGRVESVTLKDPPQLGVTVIANINSDIRVPETAKVRVEIGKLLGGTPTLVLDVSEVAPEVHSFLPTDGSAKLEGVKPQRVEEELIAKLKEAFKPAYDKMERLVSSFETLSEQWQRTGRNIERMTEVRDPDAPDAERNLYTAIVQAERRLTEMQATIKHLDEFLSDPALKQQIRDTIASVDKAAKDTSEMVTSGRDAVTQLREDLSRLSGRYYKLADDLSAAIRSAQQVIDSANEGEGTVARLLNDPQLYNDLTDTVRRAEQTLDEMRQLMEKLKEEGLPVQLGG